MPFGAAAAVAKNQQERIFHMKHSIHSRLLSALLALLMVISLVPATVFAADPVTATLVTDVTALAAGDQVVIVAKDYDYAMSTSQKNNNRGAAAITKDGSTVTLSDDTQILTLEAGSVAGTWAFKDAANGYLYAAGQSKAQNGSKNNNHLKSQAAIDGNASWLVTIGSDGNASVVAQGDNGCNIMRYNSGSTLFSAYASGQADIQLYKLGTTTGGGGEPTPPAGPTIVNISDALAGADGTEFTVKGVVTLVDGTNIYLQDATGGICSYYKSAPADIALGDTIIVTGKRGNYNQMPQLSGATYEKSSGLTLEAKATTIGALTDADLGTYVKLTDVEVVSTGNAMEVKDATGSIKFYKGQLPDGIAVGDKLNVLASVGTYKGTLQLRNTLASEVTPAAAAPTYDTIAQALAGADGTEFTVKGVITLVDGKNLYLQDATGGICLRISSGSTSADLLGKTVIGTGSKTVYSGLPQLGSGSYELSDGMTLTAKETTIGGLTTADICTYITLKGVEITEIYDKNGTYTSPNITVKDSTGASIQLYKAVINKNGEAWEYAVGDKLDVTAAVSAYNTTLQLRNTVATEIAKHVEATGGKITSADGLVDGTYVMVVETGYAPGVLDGTWITAVQPSISGDQVVDAQGGIWTLKVTGNTVKIIDSKGVAIAPKGGDQNGIKGESYDWLWSFDEATQTFTFSGQSGDPVKLASNVSSSGKFRAYRDSTISGKPASYPYSFTLYSVAGSTSGGDTLPADGSQVLLYNLAAKGVLALEGDNQVITNAEASFDGEDKLSTVGGALIFKVEKNGDWYRFYNESFGYLCSNGTGNNAFYSTTASEDADWKLAAQGSGYTLESRTAKFNGKYSQYLEYYADSYKTYSMYNVTDYSIYTFQFVDAARLDSVAAACVYAGVVNVPTVVPEFADSTPINTDYTFSFTATAPFGVIGATVRLATESEGTPVTPDANGLYTVTIPGAKVTGEELQIIINVDYTNRPENVISSTRLHVTVVDEPVISDLTPANGTETGTEKRPVISAAISNEGEDAQVTMKVNGALATSAKYENGRITYTPNVDMADGRVNVTVEVTRKDGKSASRSWSFTVGEAQYQLYFGQLHSHTTYSDGSGTLEAALEYVKNLPESANVDFVAFTDHSNYFDKSGAANPEAALYDMTQATAYSQETWAAYKNAVEQFNASQSDVVAIAGFEMTWSGGPGHMNTFNTPGIVSRNNSTLNNKTSDAGMKAYYALLSQAEGVDAISQFNHPGNTFGTFADFSYWDAVIDSRIQLVEVGNGEGQVGSGGYFPSYEYYTMALDKGWHVAPTNNQDNHKGKWGNANEARDVIITDDFSETGIYNALRDRRVYSTEDKNLEITYTVNGLLLGSSITEVPEKLNLAVTVNDPDAADSIQKVEVIVNSGKVAHSWTDAAVLATGDLKVTLDPTYSYYYIRVTQADGDLAVTAPVWVGESLKLGISSVECATSTPVTGEELTLNTTLFNSEKSAATVKSISYAIKGGESIGVDTTGYTVPASGTLTIPFKYTPAAARVTTITATAVVVQGGQEYVFSMDVQLDVQDADKMVYIGIDASHYNEYVAGNYKDNMGNFSKLAAEYSVRTVELNTSEALIAACGNAKYKAIILTAPSRRNGDALREPYKCYTADEIAAIKAFNQAGGTVILAGWSDHYENYGTFPTDPAKTADHMAVQQNNILAALGSSLRIGDDATYDDQYNGGQAYRLYFNTYGESFLTEGVEVDPEHPHDRMYTEVFSHYGGATVYTVDGTLPATVSPVVFGHAGTYSVDSDKDGLGGASVPKYTYAAGDDRLMVMASEQLPGQGLIVVSGAAFMSNFEVQAELDNAAEKNYSNYRICENLLGYINPVVITPIAEVQAQEHEGVKYTIEGIVTSNASGYDKDTAFFDCIYVQDETGGINAFPVAGVYQIGDKVRITGTTSSYQGERQIAVTSIELISQGHTVAAKDITAAQLNNKSVLGQLVKLQGTVVSFEKANGLVQTIMVKDAAGNIGRVFIDGYIDANGYKTAGGVNATDVVGLQVGASITVVGCASYDNTFVGTAARIRVRSRADVVCVGVDTSTGSPVVTLPAIGEVTQIQVGDKLLAAGTDYSVTVSGGDYIITFSSIYIGANVDVTFANGNTVSFVASVSSVSTAPGSTPTSPDTGDNSSLALYSCLLIVSLLGMAVLVGTKRKQRG